MIDDESVQLARKRSKNSSRAPINTSLLPRTVGFFNVNVCRNPLCSAFSEAPVLYVADPSLMTGKVKGSGEGRNYTCSACGQSFRLKSNTALVEEYSRLRTLHRGTKREYCPNIKCTSHGVPASLMPSAYYTHGKTPKGDARYQCKSCKRTFSVGSPTRRQSETTENTLILKLLVNAVGLRRIMEIADIPASRLYHRIEFLADQCRVMAAHKDRGLAGKLEGRNIALSTDVQTILANWLRADRILNVPVLHAVTVERDSGYVVVTRPT